ncbi:MAG: hypothetical protein DRH12_11935, partial [Deltaproteobacteria bacterium]
MKKIIALIIVALLVVGGVRLLKKRREALSKARPPRALAVRVDSMKAELKEVTVTLPVLAEVRSRQNATVSTKISGTITLVNVKEGTKVEAGTLLAKIDDRDLRAKKVSLELSLSNLDYEIASKKSQLASLKIKLSNALDTHRRTKELYKVKGASIEQLQNEASAIASLRAELDAVTNGLKSLENQKNVIRQKIKELDATLSYTTIKSPISGTVSRSFVSQGELATPGRPLFSISSDEGYYLVLHLPSDISPKGLLLDGHELQLTPLALADNNGLRQYAADIPQGLNLVAGEIVDGDLVLFSGNAVLLPPDAILIREGKKLVFTFENGRAKPLKVKVLASGKEGVIVEGALNGKTIIVAKPDILLRLLTGVPVILDNLVQNRSQLQRRGTGCSRSGVFWTRSQDGEGAKTRSERSHDGVVSVAP